MEANQRGQCDVGRTGILYDSIFLLHDTREHPEHPDRLRVISRALAEAPFAHQLEWEKPAPATRAQIEAVHTHDYVRWLEERILSGADALDIDTPVCRESWDAAVMAAGAVISAVNGVYEGRYATAFCPVRPPGHHAEPARAMGFCLLNNVAIAARHAATGRGARRVAIVDFDVHHGNGTQKAFYNDPSVLYVSTHQAHHYPGTGWADERGAGAGEGANLNLPLESGAGDREFLGLFDSTIIPTIRKFAPELILVSAGFDGHRDDPLGGMDLTEQGFAGMTAMLVALARELGHGRVVSALEGGYNLAALARSVAAHVGELARD